MSESIMKIQALQPMQSQGQEERNYKKKEKRKKVTSFKAILSSLIGEEIDQNFKLVTHKNSSNSSILEKDTVNYYILPCNIDLVV